MIQIFNLKEDHENYIVARYVDGEYWYYGSWDNEEDAHKASQAINGQVFCRYKDLTINQLAECYETSKQFDEYLMANLDNYGVVVHGFALDKACEWLQSVGIEPDDFRERMDIYKTEVQ